MQSVFVYTREAHPGEHRGPHASFEDKLDAARHMARRWSIRRRMLVDALDGPVHRAFGSLPNMSFVVGRGGFVIYKANWTDASHLDLVVRRVAEEAEPLAPGLRRVPFQCEWAPRRARDEEAFLAGLLEAGPRAVTEFRAAMERSRRG